MSESKEIATTTTTAIALPELDEVEQVLTAVRKFQRKVQALMIEGHDYGRIEGTDRPTLLKPGAEKIVKLFKCAPRYEVLDQREDFERGFFYYKFKCELVHLPTGQVVDEGYGSCSTMEGKYRWRWVYENDLPPGVDKNALVSKKFKAKRGGQFVKYRILNDDTYTLQNTVLKMAKKRALVDAALSLGRLSDIFTQDIEDIVDEETAASPPPQTPATSGAQAKANGEQRVAGSGGNGDRLIKARLKALFGKFKEHGVTDKEEIKDIVTRITGQVFVHTREIVEDDQVFQTVMEWQGLGAAIAQYRESRGDQPTLGAEE